MSRSPQRMVASILSFTLVATTIGPAYAQDVTLDPENQPTLTGHLQAAIERLAVEAAGDPQTAREIVSAAIRPEAYQGVIKGPRGTYQTGAGNGADQALLLATLLDAATPTRFAGCELDAEAGAALVEEWQPVAPVQLDLDGLGQLAGDATDPDLAQFLDSIDGIERTATEDARALASDLVASGWAAVESAPTTPSMHHWLQVEREGAWIDLDTTTPGGTPRCEATETSTALADELMHRTTIRVIGEHSTPDGLTEETLLEHSLPTHELATARIAFVFGEPAGLIQTPRASNEPWAYTPLLRIDNADVIGEPLYLPPMRGNTGDAFSDASDALGGLLGGDEAGGGAGGALDGLGGPDGGQDGKDGSELPLATAAWLEIEFDSPGGSDRIVRSEVFDRVGPAARANGTADFVTMTDPKRIGSTYVDTSALWQVAIMPGPIAVADGIGDAEGVLFSTFDGFSGQLDGLLRMFPGLHGAAYPAGQPAVLALGLELGEDGAGEPVMRSLVDALHVPGLSPADANSAADDALSLIAAERILISVIGEPSDLNDAASVFRTARESGSPIVRVEPGEALEVAVSGDAMARIVARQAEGLALVIPAAPPVVDGAPVAGWFTIDPSTGLVRDQFQNGRHPATEDAPTRGGSTELATTTRTTQCRVASKYLRVVFLLLGLFFNSNAVRADEARRLRQAEEVVQRADDAGCSL